MKVLIVKNAYIKNKSQISQAERIAEELIACGAEVDCVKNFNLSCIEQGKIRAKDYSFCVFLDKDRVAARLLEGYGMRLFNRAEAIEVCDDKMLTNVALARADIPVPDCMYAPLCYYNDVQPNKSFLQEVAQKFGFPLVAKINYGSLGAGVALINSFEELLSYEQANMLTPHFYQRFVVGGEDVRVIVIGKKFVCAMKRTNASDFRSNIELGGKGEKIIASPQLIALCEKVAKTLNLDYCGVDVLKDENNKLYICEVNSNAFFATAEKVCGVNVAKLYARHMLGSI